MFYRKKQKGQVFYFLWRYCILIFLMDPLAAMMKSLGNPEITAELKQTITQGVLREAGNRSVEQLAQEESEMLVGLLRLRAGPGHV
jgi:hypothetical protein